jgi:xylose dehydrogenase (NAD/NADP)
MLRFGILGCARICRRDMIPALRAAPGIELTAIASRRPGEAAKWAAEFKIPQSHESYEAILADPSIDAVYLPLANEQHKPWVLAAAAAGKHVLCEKPLALDSADAEEMASACRRAGVMLMEAFMWRHHPWVAAAKDILAEGKIGELRLIKMDFSFSIQPADWRLDPQRGGGALFDLGCYGINLSRLFAGGEPTEIIARSRMSESGVDLTTAMILRFANRVTSLLDCSFECLDRNRIELVGTRGSLELPRGVLPPEEAEMIVTTTSGRETIRFPRAHQFVGELLAFAAGIQEGRLPAPAEDGRANMRVLDEVKKQAWKSSL